MTPFELRDALDGMVVLVDTREQDTSRLRARLDDMGCAYERQKLDFGDYSAKFPLPGGGWLDLSSAVCVERKMNLDELCGCFCKDRARFSREFERAKAAGAKTYLLIENASWEMAFQGNYRSKMAANSLVASLCAWLARYNCQLIMCKQQTSGKLIHELLYREGKERLEAMEDGEA